MLYNCEVELSCSARLSDEDRLSEGCWVVLDVLIVLNCSLVV